MYQHHLLLIPINMYHMRSLILLTVVIISRLQHYIGPNAAMVFYEYLENDAQSIHHNHLNHIKVLLPLCIEQENNFKKSKKFHICNYIF